MRAGEAYLRGLTTAQVPTSTTPPYAAPFDGSVTTVGSVPGIIGTPVDSAMGNCDPVTYWMNGFCWSGTTTVNCANSPPTVLSTPATCATNSHQTTGFTTVIGNNPMYVIEYIYQQTSTGTSCGGALQAGSPSQGGCTSTGHNVYRVTARSNGGNSNAVVILQSIYVPPS